MAEPLIQTTYFQNIYLRTMEFINAGDQNHAHKHFYDHISFISKGSFKIECEGKPEEILTSPSTFVTPKEEVHQFTAMEPDSIMCCIHALKLDGTEPEDLTQEQAQDLVDKLTIRI